MFSIGAAFIDFIPSDKGVALKDVSSFQRASREAPANVAACVAKLGGKSAFIGKVGYDPFGDYLIGTLAELGVDVSHILRTAEAKTALAFVALGRDGNRDFTFYRNPGADIMSL
jgi:fructokinase